MLDIACVSFCVVVFLTRYGVDAISLGSTAEFSTYFSYRNIRLDYNYRLEYNYRNAYNKSRVECAVLCYGDQECLRIAYNNATRECRMDREATPFVVHADDWTLYPLAHRDCPTYDTRNDVTAADLSIKRCSNKLSKTKAERACARYGRLLELRTERLVEDTISAITHESEIWNYCDREGYMVAGTYTEDFWTWLLPDGSPIWRNNASSSDNDVTSGDCVLVNENGTVSVDCNVSMCYICQRD